MSEADIAPYTATGFSLPSPIGPIAVSVTTTADPELPKDRSDKWLKDMWPAVFGPLALLSPMFAGAFVVGSGLIITLGGTGYSIEKSGHNAIVRGVSESNFPAMLADALRSRAMPSGASGDAPMAQALIVVRGYGLAGHCFVAAAELSVDRDNRQILNESLLMTFAERSVDAPPLQCAELSRFAAENGRLIRETARDYAEVFAVMAIRRLLEIR